jgi:hypothetical protein
MFKLLIVLSWVRNRHSPFQPVGYPNTEIAARDYSEVSEQAAGLP